MLWRLCASSPLRLSPAVPAVPAKGSSSTWCAAVGPGPARDTDPTRYRIFSYTSAASLLLSVGCESHQGWAIYPMAAIGSGRKTELSAGNRDSPIHRRSTCIPRGTTPTHTPTPYTRRDCPAQAAHEQDRGTMSAALHGAAYFPVFLLQIPCSHLPAGLRSGLASEQVSRLSILLSD